MRTNKIKQELVRFHVEFGPPSLFERVQFIMKGEHELNLNGAHYQMRVEQRQIPDGVLKELQHFDSTEWKVKTAEVRRDRGKFYNSTWQKEIDGVRYWVTIGMNNIMTIVIKNSSGIEKCVKDGEFYDFVETVNRQLMDAEKEPGHDEQNS